MPDRTAELEREIARISRETWIAALADGTPDAADIVAEAMRQAISLDRRSRWESISSAPASPPDDLDAEPTLVLLRVHGSGMSPVIGYVQARRDGGRKAIANGHLGIDFDEWHPLPARDA